MKRVFRRANLAGVLILGFVFVSGINVWQRLDESVVPATIRNFTLEPRTVRLSDGTTGDVLGTYEIPELSTTVLLEHRLSVWYRDLTIGELAVGRADGVIVELFAARTCELVSRQRVDHRDPRIDIMDDGLVTFLDESSPRAAQASVVADPCGGRPGMPSAEIANETVDTIVLGNGVSVPPCSVRTFHPGDVSSPAATGEALVRVRVPSVDAQDERWPMERRVIAIGPEGITDEPHGAFGRLDPTSCYGHAPPEAVISS